MEHFDILIAGAGPAGLCAALQASREGAKTLLIEKNGICGGTLTFCGINYISGFDAWGKMVVSGIGFELAEKARTAEGRPFPPDYPQVKTDMHVDPLIFASIADEELLKAKCDLRYHTMPGKAERKENKWIVTLCGKDGLYEVSAEVVIDCTGDANLVKMAGLPYRQPETTQPGTLSIYCHNFDMEKLDLPALEKAFDEAAARGEVTPEDMGWAKKFNKGFFTGFGGNSNHITDINACDSSGRTKMEIEGRRSVMRLYRFLKKQPGLEQIEFHIRSGECGVRETRTIVGETTVTKDDYVSGRRFDDAVCNAYYYKIDLHDAEHGLIQEKLKEGTVPTVPFGALIPKGSVNFLAAGRILSSDRLANSALRIQATCMATGQAAGAAAVLACRHHTEVRKIALGELRTLLRANKALI